MEFRRVLFRSNSRDFVIAAGVVADSDLVERWNISKVRGRGEWTRELRVAGRLRSAAIKGSLSRRLLAEGVAERTGAGSGGRSATASSGKNELGTERPLVHKAVAEHTHDARVVEDATAAAQTGLAVAKNVIGKAQTGCKAGPIGVQSILRHAGIAGNAVLRGEEHAWRRVGIDLGNGAGGHGGQVDLSPAVSGVTPRECGLVAQAEVEGQAARDPIVVLDVDADKIRAIVLELSRTLLESEAIAHASTVREDASEEKLIG